MLREIDSRRDRVITVGRIGNTSVTIPGIGISRLAVAGFEDVFEQAGMTDRLVGQGQYYNTPISVGALAGAIKHAKDPAAQQIISDRSLPSGRAVVEALRKEQVLSDMRIIDLGSGMVPGFALAAKALGATVQTVDIQQQPASARAVLDGHIQIDLSRPDAAELIGEAAGPPMDYVSQCIIGHFPETEKMGFEIPSHMAVDYIGNALLKPGGILYSGHGDTFEKV